MEEDNPTKVYSVSEALRLLPSTDDLLSNIKPESVKVRGIILSVRPLCKMITDVYYRCPQCGSVYPSAYTYDKPEFSVKTSKSVMYCSDENSISHKSDNKVPLEPVPEYVNAVVVELQDDDKFSDLEKLHTILFDNDTIDILLGERVIITGNLYILQSGITKNSRYYPCLYSNTIHYESKQEMKLTKMDIEAIKRFVHCKDEMNIIDALVDMFAPSIIGYEHVKKGMLIAATSSGNDVANGKSRKQRRRLHAILVGDPGLSKSIFLKEVSKIVAKSRYESGQSSSAKSLTAIVTKEEDGSCVLRCGPVPLAKEGICSINEIGRIGYEDQALLLDVMEEGEFTINKHGVNARVRASTTIVGSANPVSGSQWNNKEKIDLDEIPAIKPLLDRFDLIFVFRTSRDEAVIRKYALEKSRLDDQLIPDYTTYLTKHIMYAKQVASNPKISEEASAMLNEYYIEIAKTSGSPRVRETVFNIARMIARLKLRNVVTSDDAKEACDFYNVVLQQYSQSVIIPSNPMDRTFNLCLNILESQYSHVGIAFEELIKEACKRSEHVRLYIGNKFKTRDNMIMRKVLDRLLNHSHVMQIKQKPAVLRWVVNKNSSAACDTCDICDQPDSFGNSPATQNVEVQAKNSEIIAETVIAKDKSGMKNEVPGTFQRSHVSHISHSKDANMAAANESGNGIMESGSSNDTK